MERVNGVGGVFFRARDPKALAAWYRDQLGVPVEADQTYAPFSSDGPGEMTVWSTFPEDTEYFGPAKKPLMVNYRVTDLDAWPTWSGGANSLRDRSRRRPRTSRAPSRSPPAPGRRPAPPDPPDCPRRATEGGGAEGRPPGGTAPRHGRDGPGRRVSNGTCTEGSRFDRRARSRRVGAPE